MSKARRPFRFRQFVVEQSRAAMPVTTDACVFGAMADFSLCRDILDIGTGTGLLSLMLAQRYPQCRITAVELQSESCVQAGHNFLNSPWRSRIECVYGDVLEYLPQQKPDGIICNPPFFEAHLPSEEAGKRLARHSGGLNYANLIQYCRKTLGGSGRLSLLVPANHLGLVRSLLEQEAFVLKKLCGFCDTEQKAAHVYLVEAGFEKGLFTEERLVLYDSGRRRSADLTTLMKDFYPQESPASDDREIGD